MGTQASNVEKSQHNLLLSAFWGGGAAGLFVDIVLFPLDTLKTRLQAEQGFKNAGAFKGIYKGLGPQVIGSAPQAALFFVTYESIKHYSEPLVPKAAMPFVYMFGASIAEVMACLVRVPMEIAKQRKQISPTDKSSLRILMSAYKYEGFFKFPTLEFCKSFYRQKFKNNIPLDSWEVAVCGSIAGGASAAITTPLDVVKTRIMLADRKVAERSSLTFANTFKKVLRNEGLKGLFAGIVPRTLWIFLGGYIFFGSYDFAKNNVFDLLEERSDATR
ncbi:hypothetical protein YQE_10176, partial [Dendroctonus ponderosae]